jgi:uncharacterized protein YndB with AHSA1/START domain
MWSVEHTAHSSASPEAVWALWANAAEWPRWNPTIAEVSLDGPFAEGTTGRLKPTNGPSSAMVLRDVRPAAGFSDVARLLGAQMRVEHEVADAPEGGSRVTERAVLHGPLARLWSLLLGRQLRRDMAAGAQATARTAAEKSGNGKFGT